MTAVTPTFFSDNSRGFKKATGITPVTDISMPSKSDQHEYNTCKYRGSQGGISIVFYGDKGNRIIVKHSDAYKLKFRTVSNNKSGYETLLLNSSDLTSLYDNNVNTHHILYTLRQYIRIGYEFERLMIIQKVTKEIMINNDKSSSETIENISINMSFETFNHTLEMIDSIGTLESITYSTVKLPNDIEKV